MMAFTMLQRLGSLATVLLTTAALSSSAPALDVAPTAEAAPKSSAPAADRVAQEENTPYNGQFIFARLRYSDGGSEGLRGFGRFGRRGRGDPGWYHDYPDAEYNLMQIFSVITTLRPGSETGNIVDIGDPELHRYPIAYMSEPGFWTMTEAELENMRSYLQKGGFLIFDDFPNEAWENFSVQMQQLLPNIRPIALDPTHEIFHSFFDIDAFEQLYYSYRGRPLFVGYFEDNDPNKRMFAIANYMNDLGENWEYAARGLEVVDVTNQAFKFGVNYILYGMTH